MRAFLFYIAYPLLYLVSLLPFPLLYFLSDILYFLIKTLGYRKKVVLENIRNSFPEKSHREHVAIADNFYKWFSDLILETLKTLTISKEEEKIRCTFHKPDWLDSYFQKGRSMIALMGHYGNWEWSGGDVLEKSPFELVVVYKPLTNPYFNQMTIGMRTRLGTRIVATTQVLRSMVESKSILTITTFIADQLAAPDSAHWMKFLNQDTAVYTGPERLARKFNYPVFFAKIKRVRRGYYEIFPEMITDQPRTLAEGTISRIFMEKLEEQIQEEPACWLWSHKRWKHKRLPSDT